MQIISNVALISINETIFVQLISFLIFMYLIDRLMFRPLKSTMSEREGYIENLGREVEDKAQETAEILKQLKERELSVISEAHSLRVALEEEGERKASEINAGLLEMIAGLRQQTEKTVSAQIREAKKSLETESEKLAVSIMEKILDRRLG